MIKTYMMVILVTLYIPGHICDLQVELFHRLLLMFYNNPEMKKHCLREKQICKKIKQEYAINIIFWDFLFYLLVTKFRTLS